jgi:hypothetical protein
MLLATVTPSVHKFINDVLMAIGPGCCDPQFTMEGVSFNQRSLAGGIFGLRLDYYLDKGHLIVKN